MEYFENVKKIVDGMTWDITVLQFLKSGEPLVGLNMDQEEAELLSLKHLKDSNILLMNELANINKLNGDDKE